MGVLTSNPLVTPSDFNVISVAGVSSPGSVEITGAERPYKWDEKPTAGAQGSTITYRGWDLAKPQAKFTFWEPEQISTFFTSFLPLLQYDASKTSPKPVQCSHPAFAAADIKAVVVTKIGQLENDGNQRYSIIVEFLEYRLPPKVNATSTPKSSSPDSPKKSDGSQGPKQSAAEDALDRATDVARAKAAQPLPKP